MQRERIGDRITIFRDLRVSPKWYAQFSHNGRQHRPSLKTESKKNAVAMAKKLGAELELGIGDYGNQKAVTISDAMQKFFISLRDRNRQERTIKVYANDLNQFLAGATTMESGNSSN